jgi:hypothetical protein
MNQEPVGLRTWISTHSTVKTVAVGVTAAALTPIVLPLVKPALKATIKSGITLFEKAKGAIAETGEVLADIAAEAKAEAYADAGKRTVGQPTASTASPATVNDN